MPSELKSAGEFPVGARIERPRDFATMQKREVAIVLYVSEEGNAFGRTVEADAEHDLGEGELFGRWRDAEEPCPTCGGSGVKPR